MKRSLMALVCVAGMLALSMASVAFSGAVAHAAPTLSAGHQAHEQATGTCYQYGCDGKPVQGSTCQQDGQKLHDKIIYSKTQPGQEMFEFTVYASASCGSAWAVITNVSGGALTNATTNIARSLPNQSQQTTGPVTLANGASAYSPMLGMVEPQDTLWAWDSANDIGGKSILYSPKFIFGGGHG